MKLDDFEHSVRGMAEKAAYNFTILTFATLALSYQFSPSIGRNQPWILIMSWIFLFVASFAGGWLILKAPIYYRINLQSVTSMRRLQILKSPEFQTQANLGQAETDTNELWTPEMVKEEINNLERYIQKANEMMDKLEPQFPKFNKIQIVFYIIGILNNGVYAAINLYSRT